MAKGKKQNVSAEELLNQALVPFNQQPYQVPANWNWVNLGKTVSIKRGASPRPIKAFITDDENGVNWIKIGDTGEGKYVDLIREKITQEGARKSVYVEKGALLLSNSMSFGRPYILNVDGCIHDGWLAINVSDCFEKEYMYYALLSSDWYFEQVAVGTAVRNLNSERVAGLPVPLPPLAEQQRIVDRIESLFAKLDQAKELAQNALDSLETRKAAILHKAFTGELTAKWREEHGIGMDSWEEKSLKQICKLSSGGTPSRKISEYYSGNIPWIKTGEIKWNYISDSEEKITQDAINNSSAKLFQRGAVLVAMYGQGLTRGRAAILDIDAATNQAVCALIPESGYDNKFLFYYFMNNYWSFRERAFGGNQPNYSATMLGNLPISCPSFPEQQEIVQIVDSLFKKEQEISVLVDVIDKIDLMKKAILARAFRGELGTNDPSEEHALELLKTAIVD